MLTNTLEQAAATMMHEAFNGYSTALSFSYTGPSLEGLSIGVRLEKTHELLEPQIKAGRYEVVYLVCCSPPTRSLGHSFSVTPEQAASPRIVIDFEMVVRSTRSTKITVSR